MPSLFVDPAAFRPERWQGDDPGVHDRYAFVPFGGGPRRCIGHAFATLELLATVGRFAQRVDATPVGPFPQGHGVATWAPAGVPLRIDAVRAAP